jgi:isoleucyl-tRNA synthetase
MEDFDLTRAFRMVQSFVIDELSNWYIRRNRRRFWKGENDKDKLSAYQTLHYVLLNVSILMAPAAPFLSEVFYQRIRRGDQPESVHLLEIPVVKDELIDTELEEKMWLAQTIVRIVRSLREKAKIRTRQPLAKILIPVMNPQQRRNIQYFEDVIKEEINVKTIEYVSAETEFVKKKAKPNFKVIGKKFGKLTQAVANKIKELTHDEIVKIEAGGLKIDINGEVVTIQPEDLEIYSDTIEGWLVGTEDNLTVALDTHITEELRIEGIAREFINRIQKLRKDSNFDVTDRIEIYAMVPPEFKEPLLVSKDYISKETLAERFQLVESLENGTEIEIDEKKLLISLKKV